MAQIERKEKRESRVTIYAAVASSCIETNGGIGQSNASAMARNSSASRSWMMFVGSDRLGAGIERYRTRRLGQVAVKGKQKPTEIYALHGREI